MRVCMSPYPHPHPDPFPRQYLCPLCPYRCLYPYPHLCAAIHFQRCMYPQTHTRACARPHPHTRARARPHLCALPSLPQDGSRWIAPPSLDKGGAVVMVCGELMVYPWQELQGDGAQSRLGGQLHGPGGPRCRPAIGRAPSLVTVLHLRRLASLQVEGPQPVRAPLPGRCCCTLGPIR